MPTQGEIIKELAERLERQVIIDALSQIQSMEELKEYIEKLRAKNEQKPAKKRISEFDILFLLKSGQLLFKKEYDIQARNKKRNK